MLIRKANKGDCKEIFRWRNDPESRDMSIDSEHVNYEDHYEWFLKSLSNPDRELYIGEIERERIGICRFDFNSESLTTKVSININPASRGKGFGKSLLVYAIDEYELEKQTVMIAQIKKHNIASVKIFEYAGFVLSDDGELFRGERCLSKASFRQVTPDDIDLLYDLLNTRTYSISHESMPSHSNHKKFVDSNPYEHWYIIYDHSDAIGSFYIQEDNSIGLNLSKLSVGIISNLAEFIEKEFSPNEPIASKVPPYFFINVPQSNKRLSRILERSGHKPIQISHKFSKGES